MECFFGRSKLTMGEANFQGLPTKNLQPKIARFNTINNCTKIVKLAKIHRSRFWGFESRNGEVAGFSSLHWDNSPNAPAEFLEKYTSRSCLLQECAFLRSCWQNLIKRACQRLTTRERKTGPMKLVLGPSFEENFAKGQIPAKVAKLATQC